MIYSPYRPYNPYLPYQTFKNPVESGVSLDPLTSALIAFSGETNQTYIDALDTHFKEQRTLGNFDEIDVWQSFKYCSTFAIGTWGLLRTVNGLEPYQFAYTGTPGTFTAGTGVSGASGFSVSLYDPADGNAWWKFKELDAGVLVHNISSSGLYRNFVSDGNLVKIGSDATNLFKGQLNGSATRTYSTSEVNNNHIFTMITKLSNTANFLLKIDGTQVLDSNRGLSSFTSNIIKNNTNIVGAQATTVIGSASLLEWTP